MHELRLGDDVDDFCPKCKRLTHHAIVSLVDEKPAKVRCRTCYHEQMFRDGVPPPSKKDLKKMEEAAAAAAGSTEGEAEGEESAKPKVKKKASAV